MSPEEKVNELISLFGNKKLALQCAEQVFSIRKGFKGKEYTKFVRFWVDVIVKLK